MASLLAQHLPSLFGPGRRTAWRRRVAQRVVAALLLCLGLALALGERGSGPTRRVLVAASGVAAGAPVSADDVAVEERPAAQLPADVLSSTSDAVGLRSTVAISRGEVLTRQRVLAATGEAAVPGGRLVTLPLVNAPTSVSVGDRVDVHRPGRREPVAEDALVVAVPAGADELGSISEPTVVLALPRAAAADVVASVGTDQAIGFVLVTRTRSAR